MLKINVFYYFDTFLDHLMWSLFNIRLIFVFILTFYMVVSCDLIFQIISYIFTHNMNKVINIFIDILDRLEFHNYNLSYFFTCLPIISDMSHIISSYQLQLIL
jgi:hypothetical protein